MEPIFGEACCRLCLAESTSLIEIFQLDNDNTIVDMIKDICCIEVETDDQLPKEICSECLDVITAAFNLRSTSQKNDRALRGEDVEVDEVEMKEEFIEYEPEDEEEQDEEEVPSNFEVLEIGYSIIESTFVCDKCSEVVSSKEEIQRHIMENHMHICSVCSKQCKTEFSLRIHINRMHNDSEQLSVFSCEYCKSSFKTFKQLEKHKLVHDYFDEIIDDSKLTYKCNIENCEKMYDCYSEKLFQHIKTHKKIIKSEDIIEAFVCPHCGNRYKSKQILQQHIKRHFDSGDKYPCQSCPQKFKSWGELYYHKAVHMTERPFICDLCNKGFKAKRDLRNHKKRHEEKDVKNFQCSYCHLMLKSRYTLNRHMLIHTGEKPHVCNFCNKSFTQKNEMNKHLRIHIGENTYKCDHDGCTKAFRLLAELRLHQEVHFVQGYEIQSS